MHLHPGHSQTGIKPISRFERKDKVHTPQLHVIPIRIFVDQGQSLRRLVRSLDKIVWRMHKKQIEDVFLLQDITPI